MNNPTSLAAFHLYFERLESEESPRKWGERIRKRNQAKLQVAVQSIYRNLSLVIAGLAVER